MRVLVVDNYDSFTYNLVHQVGKLSGRFPEVVQNDGFVIQDVMSGGHSHIILSPGPGRPDVRRDVGQCLDILRLWRRPLLGVCLGHQSLVHWFHGEIQRLEEVIHGRTSEIFHTDTGIFSGMPSGFQAMRYHSLAAVEPLPRCLVKTAWTQSGIVMGVRHESLPYHGVQFHPESIASRYGDRLIQNFLNIDSSLPKTSAKLIGR